MSSIPVHVSPLAIGIRIRTPMGVVHYAKDAKDHGGFGILSACGEYFDPELVGTVMPDRHHVTCHECRMHIAWLISKLENDRGPSV